MEELTAETMSSEELSYQMELEKNGKKKYKIELTCAELEFIKDVLMGVNKWEQHTTGIFNASHEFERGLEQICADDLADKIFQQYRDEDGKLR
jgi:hypothetical protein